MPSIFRLALLTFLLNPFAALTREPLDRPNFVIVFLDDAGYGDFSHTGNPTIHTPHVTRMVRQGLNFPQFYTASPACTASRYALLTGRNPARSGLGTWVLSPTAQRYIHPREITLAEGLRQRGYATGFFGKWHLGNPNEANNFTTDALPLAHGFDTWEGTNVSNDYDTGAHLIRSHPSGTTPVPGYELIAEDILHKTQLHERLTQRYGDRAVEFIEENKGEPFLLYVAPNMPHLPVLASDPWKGHSRRGLYGDAIEELDALVGRLLAKLESTGIAQNTLVLFTSDNGPWIRFQDTESHPKYAEARFLIGSALPFRDGKGSTWEGGVRVPGVFYWPSVIPPGTRIPSPASTLDVLPTLFALAGAELPTGRTLDGRDIRSYLNPSRFPHQVADFQFIYTGRPDNAVYGARRGPWKIHTDLYSQTGNDYGFTASEEDPLLFNLEIDPSERSNLADRHPSIIKQLRQTLVQFTRSLETDKIFWRNSN